jgi:hypothetical protein
MRLLRLLPFLCLGPLAAVLGAQSSPASNVEPAPAAVAPVALPAFLQGFLDGLPIPEPIRVWLSHHRLLPPPPMTPPGPITTPVMPPGPITTPVIKPEPSMPAPGALHAPTTPGYVAGQTLTVTNTLLYPGSATALSWSVLLPAGWTFVSAAGSAGDVGPRAGDGNLLEWAWSTVPPSPVTFTYTVQIPAGQTGMKELTALVGVRNGALVQLPARPDPLRVLPVRPHSADTDCNFRLSLLELTRVIELYNTRHGMGRSGSYAPASGNSEDGFVADLARAVTAVVALARHHSADTNRDGRLSLLELTRVIELYNQRSGGSRTGQYRIRDDSEDGFEPGS